MTEKKNAIGTLLAKHAFDFFSLFLAITLGFFVDNYRDDLQSNETAEEISVDLMSDLYLDTAAIDEMLSHSKNKARILEDLYSLVEDNVVQVSDSMVYLYTAHLKHRPWFDRHRSSYQLCLNTGYLQYFSKDIITGLTEYDNDCMKTLDLLAHEKQLLNSKIFPFLQHIFHTENFASLLEKGVLMEAPVLHNWNDENRWLFHNYVFELIELNKEVIGHYKVLFSKSRNTLKLLKSEYSTVKK